YSMFWIPLQQTHCYARSIIVYPIGNKLIITIVHRNYITIFDGTYFFIYSARKHPRMQLPTRFIFAFIKDYFTHLCKSTECEKKSCNYFLPKQQKVCTYRHTF